MQQRRLRLGDIVDDYCPRERRITNHAIVAMIEDEVKQTRCTTCDAEHEYKQARVPAQRRKKAGLPALHGDVPAGTPRKRPAVPAVEPAESAAPEISASAPASEEPVPLNEPIESPVDVESRVDVDVSATPSTEDEGPVHRPLIRATLPRAERQVPERKLPEFTVRHPGSRGRGFDVNGNGNRTQLGGRRPVRGQQGGKAGQQRFGAPRQGSGQGTRHGSGQPQRHGPSRPGSGQPNRHQSGPGGQQRQGRPHQGRGPRPGSGQGGRKRGR